MTTTTDISMDRVVDVPKGTYPLRHSARLIRTINHLPEGYATAEQGRTDFYDALKVAAVKGVDLPLAGEEESIYRQASRAAKRLRDTEELRDYFGNNDEGVYIWGHTRTGLRFRKADLRRTYVVGDKVTAEVIVTEIPEDIRRQIADSQFKRDNWKDVIGKINQVKGEMAVPYARGHVISAMDPTWGIFTEVEPTTEHRASYALHGWLRESLEIPQDPISGHYEVAVGRSGHWRLGGGCLDVVAVSRRWRATSGAGFRPVARGSVPEIQTVSADTNVEKARREAKQEERREIAARLAGAKLTDVQDIVRQYL